MKGVQCYELFRGIALINHALLYFVAGKLIAYPNYFVSVFHLNKEPMKRL